MKDANYRVLFMGANGDWILSPDACYEPDAFYNLIEAREEKERLLKKGFDKSIVFIIQNVE